MGLIELSLLDKLKRANILIGSVATGVFWQDPVIAVVNTPPALPTDGDRYIVGTAPTGVWDGHAGDVAVYATDAWAFASPSDRWGVFVHDDAQFLLYNEGSWFLLADLDRITEILHEAETARDTILEDDGFIAVSTDLLGSDYIGTVANDLLLGTSSLVKKVADSISNVNAVGDSIANVNSVVEALLVITAVNNNKPNINTVATSISNVNIVGDDIANVNAVAGNKTNIDAVNANKANIDAVALNEANINAVANNETNINAVNANKPNIDAVANNETNITTVATNITDINAVKNNETNINAVKANETNINAVAGNKDNIDKVANIDQEVTDVAGIKTEVENVSAIRNNITAVDGNKTNINAVHANKNNIDAVAGNKTNIDAVKNNESNINATAGAVVNIGIVAGSINNVNAVGGSINNVNAVAGNATNINGVHGNKTNIDKVAGMQANINALAPHAQAIEDLGERTAELDLVAEALGDIDDLEKVNNKKSTLSENSETYYPNQKAVNDGLNAIKGTGWTDENLVDHEERITALEGVYDIGSWADVQKIVRAGLARKYLSVGDQLVANYNGSPVVWDVIGIDHETPTDKNFTHSITILPRIVLHNAQFSAPQAFYNVGDGLGAGTHIFTFAQGNATWERQYEFETSEPIPEGGVIRATSWSDDYEISAVTTYEADRKTVVESGISVTIVTGQADTLTRAINERVRSRYGSNNYLESAIKQWMNSDAKTFEWQAQTDFDMPSSYETEGFLDLLDPELVAVLGSVDKQVSKNHHADTDGNGQFTFSDKVFLLSRVEVGLGTEGTTTGEKVYEFYDGASNADRIKLLTGDPRHWWLRSPSTSYSHRVRSVLTSGVLYYYSAHNSLGFVPACVII